MLRNDSAEFGQDRPRLGQERDRRRLSLYQSGGGPSTGRSLSGTMTAGGPNSSGRRAPIMERTA